jgi:hypothetical protein
MTGQQGVGLFLKRNYQSLHKHVTALLYVQLHNRFWYIAVCVHDRCSTGSMWLQQLHGPLWFMLQHKHALMLRSAISRSVECQFAVDPSLTPEYRTDRWSWNVRNKLPLHADVTLQNSADVRPQCKPEATHREPNARYRCDVSYTVQNSNNNTSGVLEHSVRQ